GDGVPGPCHGGAELLEALDHGTLGQLAASHDLQHELLHLRSEIGDRDGDGPEGGVEGVAHAATLDGGAAMRSATACGASSVDRSWSASALPSTRSRKWS